MDSHTFNSDSTYCSLFENSTCSNNKICKLNESEFLEEVHNKILIHWEGQRLIGRIEAHDYMKRIANMKFETYKDQYFCQKIQKSLLKIFKLMKKFENNNSLLVENNGDKCPSKTSDPMNNCSLTQDLKIAKRDIDPKHILLETTSVNNNTGKSFPIDILTNNNFDILASNLNKSNEPLEAGRKNLIQNKTLSYMESKCFTTPPQMQKYPRSMELFSSESEKAHIETYSSLKKNRALQSYLCGSDRVNSEDATPSKRKCMSNIDNKEMNTDENTSSMNLGSNIYMAFEIIDNYNSNEMHNVISSSICGTSLKSKANKIGNSLSAKKGSCSTLNNAPEVSSKHIVLHNLENADKDIEIADKHNVINTECNNVVSQVSTDTEISKMFWTDDQSLEIKCPGMLNKINSNQLVTLGNIFKETNNKKINEIICYTDTQSESGDCWQMIQNEFEQKATTVRKIDDTLDRLFDKLRFEEKEVAEKHFMEARVYKRGHFHKFSLEDEKKLDLQNFFKNNKSRLEEISMEFKQKLGRNNLRQDNEYSDDTDDENLENKILDWRKLAKANVLKDN